MKSVFEKNSAKALEEAEQRKKLQVKNKTNKSVKEIGGPGGPEPTRFGDWEKKGIVSDF
jgi:hypothetical protein